MGKTFFNSALCNSRKRCHQCRLSRAYRESIVKVFDDIDDVDFDCPHGRTAAEFGGKELPSLFVQAKNVASAAMDTAKAVVQGQQIKVSKEEQIRRIEVCAGTEGIPKCDFFRPDGKRCTKCGCRMEIKTWLAKTACPIGKWGKVEEGGDGV